MDIPKEEFLPQSLTSTLILAVIQSQSLARQLAENTRVVEGLRRENEKLKQELSGLRQARDQDGQQKAFIAHTEQMFRQDAQKQAEIDRLKAKLRNLQARKQRMKNPGMSSPIISSDEAERPGPSAALASDGNGDMRTDKHSPIQARAPAAEGQGSPPRKRVRPLSPANARRALQEIPVNKATPGHGSLRKQPLKRASVGDRGAQAIPFLAEDGDDHNRDRSELARRDCSTSEQDDSSRRRLETLLRTPAPSTPILARSGNKNASSSKSATSEPAAKNRARFLPPHVRTATGPEDEEPIRSRPLSRLNLSHFKLNPQQNDGYDYAYGEAVRGREARRCLPGCTRPECCGSKFQTISAALPRQGGATDLSDDDLLLKFFGPGSEEKIRSLTATARENAIHEARVKHVANLYGKMHRAAHDRAPSPPGFWSTAMPGTQEEMEIQEQARRREREEVERRYQEAVKANGRWMFADE